MEWPAPRTVICADSLRWMSVNQASPGTSIVTSLPDVSELSGLSLIEWKHWFLASARQLMLWVPPDGICIFFQSDIRVAGTHISKAYLVLQAAEQAGANLLWHKIICRKPPGTVAMGRPSYSHMICVSRDSLSLNEYLGADVLADAGTMTWSRAMGRHACDVACRYIVKASKTNLIVDPFCGKGSTLAAANALGVAALGIDISASRCRSALKYRYI